MKWEIKNITNKHKNTPALVVGHGPSLNTISSSLEEYKKKGFILLGCNQWPEFYDVVPHYWVLGGLLISELFRLHYDIKKYKTNLFYSDAFDRTSKTTVQNLIDGNYLPFYHRKDQAQLLNCKDYDPCKLTVQEELKKITKYDENCGLAYTVASYMMIFAILMGCNPIYIIGVDLDWAGGYAKNKFNYTPPHHFMHTISTLDSPERKKVLMSLNILNESAKKINVDIINLNRGAWFNIFKTGCINGKSTLA